MRPIIEGIAKYRGVSYTVEKSTWNRGDMTLPVKTYELNYPSVIGHLYLAGEYRRNIWQKANWYRELHDTDIYMWTIRVVSESELPSIEIFRNGWLHQCLLQKPKLNIVCKDMMLHERLSRNENLKGLLTGKQEVVSATIKTTDNVLWTAFTSLIDHETLVNKALLTMEEIEREINRIMNHSLK